MNTPLPMPLAVVQNIAASRRRTPTAAVARAVLQGDDSAQWPLRDCLEENEERQMTGLEIGKNYYVETVTKYYCGRLVGVDFSGITLAEASWIPDTGRYNEAFKTGQFKEVEPLPKDRELHLPAGVLTGIVAWTHPLPREVK